MLARILRGLIVGFTMMAGVATAALPAYAGGACLPPSQAPRGLSDFLPLIRAMTNGGVVVSACLMQAGGGLIYEIKVQIGGRVVTLRLDAATGAPR